MMQEEVKKEDPWTSGFKGKATESNDAEAIEPVVFETTIGDLLAGAVRGALTLAYGAITSLIFALLIYETWKGIFEHGEGWHDLDSLEILFLVLFYLLVKRFFAKAKLCEFNWWNRISRFINYLGLYGLFIISPIYLVAIDQALFESYSMYLDEYDLITNFGMLLVVFSMAPIPGKDNLTSKGLFNATSNKSDEEKSEQGVG